MVVRGQGVNLTTDVHLTPRLSHISTPSSCPLGVDRYVFIFFSNDVGLLCMVKVLVTATFFLTLSCFNFYTVYLWKNRGNLDEICQDTWYPGRDLSTGSA